MSTDRELLEMAAKAAGLVIMAKQQARRDRLGEGHIGLWVTDKTGGDNTCWNPLEDDGDALRLAVKLGLRIEQDWFQPTGGYHPDNGRARVFTEYSLRQIGSLKFRPAWFKEEFSGDPAAATRRAIVRAAAEIGRNMS